LGLEGDELDNWKKIMNIIVERGFINPEITIQYYHKESKGKYYHILQLENTSDMDIKKLIISLELYSVKNGKKEIIARFSRLPRRIGKLGPMAYDPPDDYHIGHQEDYLLFEVRPNEKNHLYILTQDECNSKVKLV
jgi:hypothetical protein